MKFEVRKFNLVFILLVAFVFSTQAQFDDLYYNPSDDIVTTNVVGYDNDYNDYEAYDSEYDDYESYDDTEYYEEDDYYDDYAYNYSTRIRRFHNRGAFGYNSMVFMPRTSFGFYDPFFNDPWMDPYWAGGTNVFISIGNGWGSPFGWNRWNRWNRWNAGWGYNSWGSPWGWNSWNRGWGWNNGFGNAWCPTTFGNGGFVGNRVSANPKGTYYGSRRSTSTVGSQSTRRGTDRLRGDTGGTIRSNGTVTDRRNTTRSNTGRSGISNGRTNENVTPLDRNRTSSIYKRNRSTAPSNNNRKVESGSSRNPRGTSTRSNNTRPNRSYTPSRSSSSRSSGVNRSNSRSSRSSMGSGRSSSSRSSMGRSRSSSSRSSGSRSSGRSSRRGG